MKTLIILTLPWLFAPGLQAQGSGSIQGYVLDAQKEVPLENSNIEISGTTFGRASDSSGFSNSTCRPDNCFTNRVPPSETGKCARHTWWDDNGPFSP